MLNPFVPLAGSTCLILLVWVLPKTRLGWPLWLRVIWDVSTFILLTALLRLMIGSPLEPHFAVHRANVEFWEKVIEAGWWLLSARGAIGLIRIFFVLEHRPRETQMLSDLFAGVIYIATTFAIINFVFATPIGGLIATSGIIAIVLGLALQSTLADVFSGIAVGIERPYKVGDLIWVEGDIEGQVTQMNWRSTHIGTAQDNIAVVPNSVIAKAKLINHSRPASLRTDTLDIALDAGVPPERSIAILNGAIHTCHIISDAPPPKILLRGMSGDGLTYRLGFSVSASEKLGPARSELLTQIHRHLRHNGIGLAATGIMLPSPPPVITINWLLEQSDLFGVLDTAQRDLLAGHFMAIDLPPGEVLFAEGNVPDALYIIATGAAKVTVQGKGHPRIAHLSGPGEVLGALGVITGSHYAATVTALTPLKAYRLDKTSLAEAIKNQPRLATALECLAQQGLAGLRDDASAHEDDRTGQPEMLLTSLRHLVNVLKSRN